MTMKLSDNLCKVVRRQFVGFGYLDTRTGKVTVEREEWQTGPCETPLFTEEERRAGTCRACASGWKTSDNYPVNVESFDRDFLHAVGIEAAKEGEGR